MWLWPLIAVVAAVPASPPIALPEVIRTTLDQEFPGWKLAPVSAPIQQTFKRHKGNQSPSLVAGDFDRDGKRDYGVQIALTAIGQEEQIVIIFLAREAAYEETIVQSMGLDPTVYLWVSRPAGLNDVLRVLGGPVADSAYGYENGIIHEITVNEDPEHPDPSIPRPPIPL